MFRPQILTERLLHTRQRALGHQRPRRNGAGRGGGRVRLPVSGKPHARVPREGAPRPPDPVRAQFSRPTDCYVSGARESHGLAAAVPGSAQAASILAGSPVRLSLTGGPDSRLASAPNLADKTRNHLEGCRPDSPGVRAIDVVRTNARPNNREPPAGQGASSLRFSRAAANFRPPAHQSRAPTNHRQPPRVAPANHRHFRFGRHFPFRPDART